MEKSVSIRSLAVFDGYKQKHYVNSKDKFFTDQRDRTQTADRQTGSSMQQWVPQIIRRKETNLNLWMFLARKLAALERLHQLNTIPSDEQAKSVCFFFKTGICMTDYSVLCFLSFNLHQDCSVAHCGVFKCNMFMGRLDSKTLEISANLSSRWIQQVNDDYV